MNSIIVHQIEKFIKWFCDKNNMKNNKCMGRNEWEEIKNNKCRRE